MLRFTLVCAILLSSLAGANARQLSYPFQHDKTTASTVRELTSLVDVTAGAKGESGFLPDAQASRPTVLPMHKPLRVPLAIGAPEPGSFFLFGAGLVLVGLVRRARVSR
jgi:PEP-CTERM motif